MKQRVRLILMLVVLGAGMASGLLSGSGDAWFDRLAKPAFMPPAWAFPVAWTIIYLLMGLSLALLLEARGPGRRAAIALFLLQLALNLLWSPVFFGAHQLAGGLAVIALLDVAVLAAVAAAWRVRRGAARLLLPYLLWLALATALNLALWRLNPGA